MGTRLRRHFAANVVGYVALIVAVMGVPMAWALAKNTVGTIQIKPNSVRSSDLRNNGVRGVDVNEPTLGQVPSAANAGNALNAQNALNAVNAESATSADSAQTAQNADNATNAQNATNATNAGFATSANSAFNADNAANLGGFPPSQFASIGAQSITFSCDADIVNPDGCIGDVPVTLPRSGRVLGILTGDALAFNLNDPDSGGDNAGFVQGWCQLSVEPVGIIDQGPVTQLHTTGTRTNIASIGVSAPLSAGEHNFAVTCTENDGDIDWHNLKFTVVLLSSA
jgi:hypothetical protein